jgi:hypothetical protein
MRLQTIYVDQKLVELVEAPFYRPPIESARPIGADILKEVQINASCPTLASERSRPPRAGQTLVKILQN